MAQTINISKIFVKAISFPVFIYKDEEGFFVARNLLLDISTQAKSFERAKVRIKEATLEYFQQFPEDIKNIPKIDFESTSYTDIQLHPNDLEITNSTFRT